MIDEKMHEHFLFEIRKITADKLYTNSSLLESDLKSSERSESKKISCHAILKNLYEPKMDVILTITD